MRTTGYGSQSGKKPLLQKSEAIDDMEDIPPFPSFPSAPPLNSGIGSKNDDDENEKVDLNRDGSRGIRTVEEVGKLERGAFRVSFSE